VLFDFCDVFLPLHPYLCKAVAKSIRSDHFFSIQASIEPRSGVGLRSATAQLASNAAQERRFARAGITNDDQPLLTQSVFQGNQFRAAFHRPLSLCALGLPLRAFHRLQWNVQILDRKPVGFARD
jgi:hypothetical protein